MKTIYFSFPGRRLLYAVLLGTITLLGSCKKDPEPVKPGPPDTETPAPGIDPLTPTASVTTTIAGKILDKDGHPLVGVRVKASGASALTTAEGTFMLENVSVPGNRCVVTCEKAGYFNAVWSGVPAKGQLTLTRITMTDDASTHTIPAATGGKAALPDGSAVQLPADGVVTTSGAAYTGTVNLSVHYQNPALAGFGSVVAGGDLLARRTDETTSVLYSYGILRVKLTGSSGEDLQVAPGKTATLTIDIPESQLATAPATIPLWYFDEEAGVWQEEGQAAKQGDKYIGTVKHFTDWNADDPEEAAYVRGKVVDCEGNPIPNCPVRIGQIETFTREDGTFVQRVPANTSMNVTITPFNDLFIGKSISIVNPLGAGETKNLGEIESPDVFCAGTAKGSIKTRSNDPVQSIVFRSSTGSGSMELYKPGSSFTAKLPQNTDITMKIYTASGFVATKEFKTGSNKTEINLGEIDLTNPPSTVHAIISCGNEFLAGATAKFEWADGSVTLTSDAFGEIIAKIPPGKQVKLTVSHAKGTRTLNFDTDASQGQQSLGVISVCNSEAKVGENSFVINGDGFVKAYQKLTYDAINSYAAYGMNIETTNNTVVSVIEPSSAWHANIIFEGKATGAIGAEKRLSVFLQRKLANGTYMTYMAGTDVDESNLTFEVTRYDAVGGLVEGKYSGTFMGISPTGQKTTITITEGKFSAVRLKDLVEE